MSRSIASRWLRCRRVPGLLQVYLFRCRRVAAVGIALEQLCDQIGLVELRLEIGSGARIQSARQAEEPGVGAVAREQSAGREHGPMAVIADEDGGDLLGGLCVPIFDRAVAACRNDHAVVLRERHHGDGALVAWPALAQLAG